MKATMRAIPPAVLLPLLSLSLTSTARAGMNGACCVDGVCSVTDQPACSANGGFFFIGASCNGFDCGIFACCQPDGACVDTNQALCLAAGGDFVGGLSARNCADGITCTPIPPGACCVGGGACVDGQTQAQCTGMSGEWEGPGTSCASSTACAFACCLADFSCQELNAADCATNSGNFVGGTNRESCAEVVPCPGAPSGACCIGGVCAVLTFAECEVVSGIYGGNATPCPPSSEGPCGACCNSGVCTDVASRDACEAGMGTFAGSGSVCDTPPDNFCLTGACCKQDGSCAQTTMLACDTIQGNFSVGQMCAAVSCTGACCFDDGTCSELTEANCVSDEMGAAGDYKGDGTVCSTPQLCSLTGACCFADNTCALLTRADCENTALTPPNGNGTYRGDLTVCDPIPCGPTGACCRLDGQCTVGTQAECVATEGATYQGDGVACTAGLCGAVSGACCFNDGTCLSQTQADCETDPMAGTYQGDFSVCTPDLCIVPTGACCSENTCQIVSAADCLLQPGTYQGNDAVCDPDGDSVDVCKDLCPGTPAGQTVNANGCSCLQLDPNGDDDADGVLNCNDVCPNTAAAAPVDSNGCACAQPMSSALDTDGDGMPDACDQCPGTPAGQQVDANGCSCLQLDPNGDDDADGVLNCNDNCPNTAAGVHVDGNGCACDQAFDSGLDGDGDGVPNGCDLCPGTTPGASVDSAGCTCLQGDMLAPMIANCPDSVTVALDSDCRADVPDLTVTPSVTDNCTSLGNLRFTTEPQDLSTLPVGDNPVVVTITDESGNSASCTITVTILQGDCPVPGCAPLCGMGSPFVVLMTLCVLLVRRAIHPWRSRRRPGGR